MESGMRPVDVIFLSETTGKLRPLRLRASGHCGDIIIGNVTEVLQRKECKFYGAESYTFLCRVRSGGVSSVWELQYLVPTHRWYGKSDTMVLQNSPCKMSKMWYDRATK